MVWCGVNRVIIHFFKASIPPSRYRVALILFIIFFKSSWCKIAGREFNKFCPQRSSDDLCPILYLSFFYVWTRPDSKVDLSGVLIDWPMDRSEGILLFLLVLLLTGDAGCVSHVQIEVAAAGQVVVSLSRLLIRAPSRASSYRRAGIMIKHREKSNLRKAFWTIEKWCYDYECRHTY